MPRGEVDNPEGQHFAGLKVLTRAADGIFEGELARCSDRTGPDAVGRGSDERTRSRLFWAFPANRALLEEDRRKNASFNPEERNLAGDAADGNIARISALSRERTTKTLNVYC